jgi:hypothetical protein
MRRKLFVALACAAALAAVVVSSTSAGAKTECNGTFSNTTLSGGVVVKEGDVCVLDTVTVNGGLTVDGGLGGAELFVNNSTIHGGWSITGTLFPLSDFCGNNIDGGLSVVNTELFGAPLSFGELNAGCAGGKIDGGATVNNNDGPVEFDGDRLNGGLNFVGVSGFLNELEASTVKGAAICQNVVDDGTSAPLVNTFSGSNNGCPA